MKDMARRQFLATSISATVAITGVAVKDLQGNPIEPAEPGAGNGSVVSAEAKEGALEIVLSLKDVPAAIATFVIENKRNLAHYEIDLIADNKGFQVRMTPA